jgi:hypothetical protein
VPSGQGSSPTARSAGACWSPDRAHRMFFWFIGTAIVTVRYVFRDPSFDYRLLIVGSVLPLADSVTGGAGVLHTLVFSLVLMLVVMLSTVGRRPVRKVLLGLPIGVMLHLVFDGTWTNEDLFWWPLGGWSFEDDRLPEVARGWWDLLLELVGLALIAWVWRKSRLGDPAVRQRFLRDGRLFV